MTLDWQNLAALIFVLVALGYLIWRLWSRGMMVDSGGCSSCAGCSSGRESDPPLISLEPPSGGSRQGSHPPKA